MRRKQPENFKETITALLDAVEPGGRFYTLDELCAMADIAGEQEEYIGQLVLEYLRHEGVGFNAIEDYAAVRLAALENGLIVIEHDVQHHAIHTVYREPLEEELRVYHALAMEGEQRDVGLTALYKTALYRQGSPGHGVE